MIADGRSTSWTYDRLAPAVDRPAEVGRLQAKLLEVHRNTEELRRAGRIERVVLAVNRSDYMLDEPSNTLLQVHKNNT